MKCMIFMIWVIFMVLNGFGDLGVKLTRFWTKTDQILDQNWPFPPVPVPRELSRSF